MNNTLKRIISGALLFGALNIGCSATNMVQHGQIVKVTDGDTVTLQDDQKALHKIRLAGIKNAIEPQATTYLTSHVLDKDVDALNCKQDRYCRTVATLLLDGRNINLIVFDAGLAWHYKKYAVEQPNQEARDYSQAEMTAGATQKGLWSTPTRLRPWVWRETRQQHGL